MSSRLARARHVLVTGSSGAIGRAIALELRARAKELALTLVDRVAEGSQALAQELAGPTHVEVVDLGDLDALPTLLARARAAHGPIDGLVNCAGFMEVRRFESLPWEIAERLLKVDLVAPLRLFHACLPSMVERASGFVVNVTSMAGRVPIKGCSVYGAAKSGLAMASEIAHVELAPRGVHVVTVYPGPVSSALERAARAQFNGGKVARAVPTGSPRGLARRVSEAIETGRGRVVYPSVYALGFRAVDLASRAALSLGPDPTA